MGHRQHTSFWQLEVLLAGKAIDREKTVIEKGGKEHRGPTLPAHQVASQVPTHILGS